MAKKIAITSQKGGVGKTTTAVNLGASLAVAKKPTLIIDLDPQGCAGIAFGLDGSALRRGLYEVFVSRVPIRDVVYKTDISSLDILPSNIWSSTAEESLLRSSKNRTVLRRAMSEVDTTYSFILIDCPPTLSHLTVAALAAADSVIVPVQSEFYSLKAFDPFMKLIRTVRLGINPTLAIEGFLLTMYNNRTRLSKEIRTRLENMFPGQVFKTIIPRNIALAEAPAYGVPALLYDANSQGARAYNKLASEIIAADKP